MTFTKLQLIQSDIIFKALYYTARNEGIEIPKELTETYEILAEANPNDTHAEHTIEVMEYLCDFIKDSSEYRTYFVEEEGEE
ncbi:hypothetical protein [Psychrobacillus sp. FSL H8-0487]|uniref:hypothetical protein n=1 Tax=Psychrobacillus sp. FSL H8-0487 TaxID=2921391 RepID=UPI0030F9E90F